MKKAAYTILIFIIYHLFSPDISCSDIPYKYYSPDHNISMETVFGFNDTIKQASYNQAVFFIKNDGKDFSGTISVKVGRGYSSSGPFSIETKKIFLPELSKKRIFIYFYYGNVSANAPVIFELKSDSNEVIFSRDLITEKKLKVIHSYPVRDGVNGFLTVVISDNNYGFNFMTGINSAPIKKGTTETYNRIQRHQVEYPTYEALPDDSNGYDGVNLILLSELSPVKLNYDQKKAIIRYLKEGGNVLITKSDSDIWLEEDFIKELLPAEITGAKKTLDTIGDYRFQLEGESITPIQGIRVPAYQVLDTVLKRNAKAFMSDDDTALIVKRKVGNGVVIFTAFNPVAEPFVGRKETLDMFSNIFNTLKMEKGVPLDASHDESKIGVFNSLMDTIITKDIVKKIVIFFLVTFFIYVTILGPVNYFILKHKKRLEYAWMTIPLISIIFSMVFLISGYAARGTENYIFTYNLIKIYHPNNFRLNSFMSVFASRADSYDVEIENQNIFVRAFNMNRKSLDDNIIEYGDAIKVKGINIKKWSVRNFTISGYVNEDSNYYIKAVKKDKHTYNLEHDIPFKLDRLFLVITGQVYKVNLDTLKKDGDIKYGTNNLEYYKSISDFADLDMLNFGEKVQQQSRGGYKIGTVKANLFRYLMRQNFLGNAAGDFFVALTNDSVLDYELKGTKFSKTDRTTIIIPIEKI